MSFKGSVKGYGGSGKEEREGQMIIKYAKGRFLENKVSFLFLIYL